MATDATAGRHAVLPPLELTTPVIGDVAAGELTFIGTATVLLRYGGFTILTDPNFLHRGESAYLGLGLRSKRLTEPAMQLDDLPPLDFVVLSHHHGDHFDERAAQGLPKDLPIITEPHSAAKLRSQGFARPVALRTWESQEIRRGQSSVLVTSMPGKHAPQPLQSLLPPVMGSMLEFNVPERSPLRLYITGDTLLFDQLAEIPRRFPDIDLCLIHLGGTRIAGVLLTMDAVQGVQALQLLRPRTAVPIHIDDYSLFRSPLEDFRRLASTEPLDTEIRYVERGDTVRFTAEELR
jgi:L-ascorbate metabolism protein UlaG (beta-lactamase superfamily)